MICGHGHEKKFKYPYPRDSKIIQMPYTQAKAINQIPVLSPTSPRQLYSLTLVVFTLEDEQNVWTDKSSQTNKSPNVKMGRTNFSTNKLSDIWPSGKTICSSRPTSRQQYDINSHQTDKCQTFCPSKWSVCPLVWKRPLKGASGFSILVIFFGPFFFSFSFLFPAAIDLLLGLIEVKKILRKHHQDGRFLPWSRQFLIAILAITSPVVINVPTEFYWLSKQKIILLCGWQNLNIKRLVCKQWVLPFLKFWGGVI